jgi:hypothetical protein
MRSPIARVRPYRWAVAGVFVFLLAGLTCIRAAGALDVPLQVAEPAGLARATDPCRTGIPLAPGSLTDEKKLRVVDEKGAEVPSQCRVINRRVAGDIEWVSVAFLADVPAKGTVTYRLSDTGPGKAVDKPVTVKDGRSEMTVVNGPLKLVLPKKEFAGLGEVWLDRDGDGKFARDELVSKGGALVIEGADGKVYRSVSDLTTPLKVALEEEGPLLVVVRIDGELKAQSADGKESFYPTFDGNTVTRDGLKFANKDLALGFTVRLHVWKGQTWVRTFVTMRNLAGNAGSWTDATVRFGDMFMSAAKDPGNVQVDAVNLDLDLAAAANLKYRIAGGLDGSEIHAGDLAESKGRATLYQDSSASWYWQAGTGKIWDPRLAKNKEMIKDDMAKAGRPDSPYFEWNAGSFAHTATATGYSFMGYRFYKGGADVKPGSFSVFEDLGKESAEGLRAPGWLEVDDGKTTVTVGCRWFWQMCPKSLEVKAPGTLSVGLWPRYFRRGHVFVGTIHKTHELVYDFRPSGKGLDAKDRFAAFTARLIAWPGAAHNLASRTYGDFMLPNPQDWPNYEKSALTPVNPDMSIPKNIGQISSLEIEREKYECYDVWKFGDSVKSDWHHFGQYQELDVPYCLMVQFARLGDRRLFEEAEIACRNLMDVPAHGGGYGHQMGESSHYYAFGPLLYADVAAEPFLRDSVKYAQDITKPGPWHLRSFAITMWSYWALYNGFESDRDRYQQGIKTALDYWTKVCDPKTHVIGGFDRSWQVFMLGMGGDAMGRYCEDFPAEKAYRQQLVDGYREWMEHLKSVPEDQRQKLQDKTTANGFAYAARFSGDDTFLTFAAENIVKDERFPLTYRTGVCSAKNWSETMSSQRLVQIFLHDMDKKKHPEKYKNLP